MKRGLSLGVLLILIVCVGFAFAEPCKLEVSLLNQDPYPAVQGEYVKVVFQVNGLSNPECKNVNFELVEKYPISLDASEEAVKSINAGTFQKDYESFALLPYKMRISEDALDGDNSIEVKYRFADNVNYESQEFTINVKDTRVDFEIHVKDYDYASNLITFEVLNIGEDDIEALTLEVPKQENIVVKGSKINILGDLDSNEYTTADFEAIPQDGEIVIDISYSDTINNRRMVEKKVLFESEYFEGMNGRGEGSSFFGIIFWVIVIGVVVYYFWRRHKKKKKKR